MGQLAGHHAVIADALDERELIEPSSLHREPDREHDPEDDPGHDRRPEGRVVVGDGDHEGIAESGDGHPARMTAPQAHPSSLGPPNPANLAQNVGPVLAYHKGRSGGPHLGRLSFNT